MSSSAVSRLCRNRLSFTLSAVFASAVFAGPAAGAPDGRSSAPRGPAWGTENSSVLTLTAADLESGGQQDVRLTGDGFRDCISPPVLLPACGFIGGVPLPSGALIEYMEFAVCDADPGFATARLFAWEGVEPGGTELASIVTQGDGGCSLWTSDYIGVTVDNLSITYGVTVAMSPGEVTFRAVRIFYRLQVSPAPGFASFNDVPTGHPFFQYIEALYASGITLGCGGGNYCPNATLTRGQMAVFLAKALGLYFPN